jgi:hypothetical protein
MDINIFASLADNDECRKLDDKLSLLSCKLMVVKKKKKKSVRKDVQQMVV